MNYIFFKEKAILIINANLSNESETYVEKEQQNSAFK